MQIDKKYTQYADDVLTGEIIACRWIKLACKRYLALLKDQRFEFKSKEVDRVITFCQLFKHLKGRTKGLRFILSDW